MILCNIEKDKNLLVFTFEGGKTAVYDFTTANSIGISKKNVQIETFINYLAFATNELRGTMLYQLLAELKGFTFLHNYQYLLSRIEPWLSYLDLIEDNITSYYVNYLISISDIEKGYIPWLKQNNKKIGAESLHDFRTYKIINQLPGNKEENFKCANLLIDRFSFDLLSLSKVMQINLIKSLKVDFKNFYIPKYYCDLRYFITEIPNAEKYYDANRGLDYNAQSLKEIYDNQRNTTILENESQIFNLEKLDLNELQIVVPHSMEDFTTEGIQQNNCVGHYYHENIRKGLDLIYFIRKKDDLNKSYVTCRYNILNKRSVETRLKNNAPYYNDELFYQIDEVITELLNK